jgi:flagellar hook-associated protein 1 FlgK
MASLLSILNAGNAALRTAQTGVRNAGDNIANASTPGYHRRELVQGSGSTYRVGNLSFTSGVQVDELRRATTGSLERRARDSGSSFQASDARANILGRASAIFEEFDGVGLGSRLDELFASFDNLSAAPQDRAARTRVLAAADGFASTMRGYAGQLANLQTDLNEDVAVGVQAMNRITRELAQLNVEVTRTQPPSPDLLDRQAALLDELAGTASVRVIHQGNGSVEVLLAGTGSSLVSKDFAATLSARADASGLLRVELTEAGAPRDVSGQLGAGTLGGVLRARDVDLAAVSGELDAFASRVAEAFNTAHAAGYGTDGATARNLFAPPSGAGAARDLSVDPAVAGNPNAVAAALDPTRLPGDNNNALQLASLRDQLMSDGQRPGDALRSVLTGLSDRTSSAQLSAQASQDAMNTTRSLRDQTVGVSTDEEMTNLMRYRQAYSAAAQVIRTADELVQEVLTIKR